MGVKDTEAIEDMEYRLYYEIPQVWQRRLCRPWPFSNHADMPTTRAGNLERYCSCEIHGQTPDEPDEVPDLHAAREHDGSQELVPNDPWEGYTEGEHPYVTMRGIHGSNGDRPEWWSDDEDTRIHNFLAYRPEDDPDYDPNDSEA